ncbi:MAG TPA: DUF5666 domain-containing protein [Chloroflexota bacterium]|nr:DUF5666 domain-containing protein [Chloroflexota bacterium]
MIRKLVAAGAAVGTLIVAGVLIANLATSPVAPLASASSSVATTLLSTGSSTPQNGVTTPNGFGWSGRGGHRGGGDFGGFGGFGAFGGGRFGGRGGFTVTGVNGNTISATWRGGQAITITVGVSTTYTQAGLSATLADVHTGSVIAVRGTRTGTNTVNATAITIVLPSEAGVVTGVNGSTITITGFDGASHTINTDSNTHFDKAGATAALSDVTNGVAVVAQGPVASDGSMTAVRITIQLPRLAGRVTAVNGSSYTISGRFGSTYTVNTTSSTTYVNANGSTAAASSVVSGTVIMAEGTLSADGKTMTAQRILVIPARGGAFGRFGGGFGRRGFGQGGFDQGGFGQGFGNGSAPSFPAPATGTTSSV